MTVAVTVVYPADCKFDEDYYLKTHMPLVAKKFGPHGLKTWRITRLEHADPSQKAPYKIQADLIFPDAGAARKAFEVEGKEVFGDIPNFTDGAATLMIGEIIGEGKGEN